eukprot:1157663-Rhodomonas_salina.1
MEREHATFAMCCCSAGVGATGAFPRRRQQPADLPLSRRHPYGQASWAGTASMLPHATLSFLPQPSPAQITVSCNFAE